MFNLLQPLKSQYLDDNGNPLSNGKLYSYIAGSSTPVDTFQDSSGSVPNPNPIILNSRGEADVWISSNVAYKFILKTSADDQIYTVDNVRSSGGSGGSSADELVKISVVDTQAGYLVDKLVGTGKIILSTLDVGAIEKIQIELGQLLASEINNDSSVSGVNVKDALNTLLNGLNNIVFPVTSVSGKTGNVVLNSTDISNSSAVSGVTTTNALDSLQGQINNIPTAPVTSVNGNVGVVVLNSGDIGDTSSVGGANVSLSLDQLKTDITNIPTAPVTSVNGDVGVVVLDSGDIGDTSSVGGANVSLSLDQLKTDITNIPTAPVTSVNGDVGVVVLDSGDIGDTSSVGGTNVSLSLDQLKTDINNIPTAPVTSVFGRIGVVTASAGDYTSTLITNVSTVVGATVTLALQTLKGLIDTNATDISANTTLANSKLASVVAGTNVTVDNTDPVNPIINSTSVTPSISLQDAYDDSTTPEITTDATRGAVSIKVGVADSDTALEVQDTSGTNNFQVTGEGVTSAPVLTVLNGGQLRVEPNGSIELNYLGANQGSIIADNSELQINHPTKVDITSPDTEINNLDVSGNLDVTGNVISNINMTGTLDVAGTIKAGGSGDATKFLNGLGAYSIPSGGSASPLSNKGDLYTYDTADASLPVGTDGQILVADSSETTGLKWIGNNTIGTKVLVQGRMDSSQTIPSATDTKINFVDSVTGGFDVNGEWDNATHKFVVGSSGAGTYQFMNSMFYPNNNGWSRLSIKKNGTPIDFYYGSGWENQSNSWEEPNGSWNIELVVGDEIEFCLYSTSGFSFNTTYEKQNCFQITKIGDSVTISTGVDSVTAGRDISLSGTATDPIIDHQTTSVVQTNVAILIPNSDTESMTCVNALGQTISISAPTYALGGANGRKFIYRFRSSGIHTLQWNNIGVNTGFALMGVTLPTATKSNKTLYVGCIYNGYTTRWDVVSVVEES